jgi:ribonuclease HII
MERRLNEAGFSRVAGVDEVGRGALAGPLVAAAVILPPDAEIAGLRDSKLCTPLQRERLAGEILGLARAYAIVRVQPSKIDRAGLQRCNLQALRRALKNLSPTPDYVLIDGFRMQRLQWPGLSVKKADAVSKNVAAASIVAKVYRDRSMRRYHRRHPEYGFSTNVGYGTSEHWAALKRFGPSPIHRLSFYGVTGFPDQDGDAAPSQARHFGEEICPVPEGVP